LIAFRFKYGLSHRKVVSLLPVWTLISTKPWLPLLKPGGRRRFYASTGASSAIMTGRAFPNAAASMFIPLRSWSWHETHR